MVYVLDKIIPALKTMIMLSRVICHTPQRYEIKNRKSYKRRFALVLAEKEGFGPSHRVTPIYSLSRGASSTT